MVEDNSLELACPSDLSVYNLEDDSAVACEEPDPTKVNNGNFVFKNSNGIHIGDKTYYTAPVTIKQFVVPNVNTIKDGQEIPDILGTLPIKFSTELSDGKDTPADENCWEFSRRWLKVPRNMAIAVSTSALVFALIFTIIYFSIGSKKEEIIHSSNNRNDTLQMKSRAEWGAIPPEGPINDIKVCPIPMVVISHTGSSLCLDQLSCSESLRSIQRGAMSGSGYSDIPYNFLIGGDGRVYVGRGWDKEGAHTRGYNNRSIGISFIGNFVKQAPLKEQVTATKALIDEGVLLGIIDENYKLFAHSQLSNTQSPGALLYNELKTWPHWSKDVS